MRNSSAALVCLLAALAGSTCFRQARASADFHRTIGAEVLSVSEAGGEHVNLQARLLAGTDLHAAGATVSMVASCSATMAARLQPGDRVMLDWRHSSGMVPAPDGRGGHAVEHESWYVVALAPPPPKRRPPPGEAKLRIRRLLDEACAPGVTPERLQQLREALVGEGPDGERLLRRELSATEASLAEEGGWVKRLQEWWDGSRSLGQRRRAVLRDLIAACGAASPRDGE